MRFRKFRREKLINLHKKVSRRNFHKSSGQKFPWQENKIRGLCVITIKIVNEYKSTTGSERDTLPHNDAVCVIVYLNCV